MAAGEGEEDLVEALHPQREFGDRDALGREADRHVGKHGIAGHRDGKNAATW